jgi:hypothetical protein
MATKTYKTLFSTAAVGNAPAGAGPTTLTLQDDASVYATFRAPGPVSETPYGVFATDDPAIQERLDAFVAKGDLGGYSIISAD